MSLLKTMKDRLKVAMKNHDEIEKNILRVAIGEVNQLQMTRQQGIKEVTDEQIAKIIRKLQESNKEVLQNLQDSVGEREHILQSENVVLDSLLPEQLNERAIMDALTEEHLWYAVTEAQSAGQAVGVAMKQFKQNGFSVDGNLVKSCVEKVRLDAEQKKGREPDGE